MALGNSRQVELGMAQEEKTQATTERREGRRRTAIQTSLIPFHPCLSPTLFSVCMRHVTSQVKAFERRCRQLYGASPGAKRKRAAEEAAAQAAGFSYPCGGFLFPGIQPAVLVVSLELLHKQKKRSYCTSEAATRRINSTSNIQLEQFPVGRAIPYPTPYLFQQGQHGTCCAHTMMALAACEHMSNPSAAFGHPCLGRSIFTACALPPGGMFLQ